MSKKKNNLNVKNLYRFAKLITPIVISVLLVLIIVFSIQNKQKIINSAKVDLPPMELVVSNESRDWVPGEGQANAYKIPFAKINSLSFGKRDNDLYIKFDLDGPLPEGNGILPAFQEDKIRSITYDMTFNGNYFDATGHKNPANNTATVKVSFYGGTRIEKESTGSVNVDGSLVDGGPGYSYFIVKYPINQLLFDMTTPKIVVTASDLVTTEKFQKGGSGFNLVNTYLAATPENPKEIMIDLSK